MPLSAIEFYFLESKCVNLQQAPGYSFIKP